MMTRAPWPKSTCPSFPGSHSIRQKGIAGPPAKRNDLAIFLSLDRVNLTASFPELYPGIKGTESVPQV